LLKYGCKEKKNINYVNPFTIIDNLRKRINKMNNEGFKI